MHLTYALCLLAGFAAGHPKAVIWQNDYAAAYKQAVKEGKDLLIHFRQDSLMDESLRASEVSSRLTNYICLTLPLSYEYEGQKLLTHSSMRVLRGQEGVAILSLHDKSSPWFREIVASRTVQEKGKTLLLPSSSEIGEMLTKRSGNTNTPEVAAPVVSTPVNYGIPAPVMLPANCRT